MILFEQQMAYTLPKKSVYMTVSTLLFYQICKQVSLKHSCIKGLERLNETYLFKEYDLLVLGIAKTVRMRQL